jgi:pimeloyl-ACP methyl ester carboxylesterase
MEQFPSSSPRLTDVGTVDGHALAADILDGPGASPVLLLHGLSQQARFWLPVIRRLRARPVLALDQRGHGRSDVPLGSDFSISRCADDAFRALSGMGPAVVVGHSWGAWVALQLAVDHPEAVRALVLIDGGAWSIPDSADREATRERLRPPALGIPEEQLWEWVASESPWFTPETREALEPTFTVDEAGAIRTRIGVDRHMAVLDGILDFDALAAWDSLTVPTWLISCESTGEPRELDLPKKAVIQRWEGAVHDVPLQWPTLVAGLIDQVVERADA